MPLGVFPLLRDNTRLIKHGDTLYKLKVKYDRSSFNNGSCSLAQSEAHSEIEQVFRAVVYMIERHKDLKPILTNHFLVQIQQVQWSFLKKYKNLVFTKDNRVLRVHDFVLEFVVKKNVVDKAPVALMTSSKNLTQATVVLPTTESRKQVNKTDGKSRENVSDIETSRDYSEDDKLRNGYRKSDAVVTIYDVEKPETGQSGSRFCRDEKGRMCRIVQSGTEKQDGRPAAASSADLTVQQTAQDRLDHASHPKRPHHADLPNLAHQVSTNKQVSRNSMGRQEKPSPRGRRHSARLKTLTASERRQGHRVSYTKPATHASQKMTKKTDTRKSEPYTHQQAKQSGESELSTSQSSITDFYRQTRSGKKTGRERRRPVTKTKSSRLENESDSQSDTENSDIEPVAKKTKHILVTKRKSRQHERDSQLDTETSDIEPVAKKPLRSSGRLSGRQSDSSSMREATRGNRSASRRSGRLTRYREDLGSTESERTGRGNKSNNNSGQDSDDGVKQRKRKLYMTRSSPQLIASGAPSGQPSLSSSRISTVRPVKRDNSEDSGQRIAARGQRAPQHTSGVANMTRTARLQLQEEETQRMELLRNSVGLPVPRYRELLVNRRDRHTVEQAEREETNKLRQLYEPTVPRRSPRQTPNTTQRRSSGLWGKFMENIVTPTKQLFIRK